MRGTFDPERMEHTDRVWKHRRHWTIPPIAHSPPRDLKQAIAGPDWCCRPPPNTAWLARDIDDRRFPWRLGATPNFPTAVPAHPLAPAIRRAFPPLPVASDPPAVAPELYGRAPARLLGRHSGSAPCPPATRTLADGVGQPLGQRSMAS